jgi:hypothetical protein
MANSPSGAVAPEGFSVDRLRYDADASRLRAMHGMVPAGMGNVEIAGA